MHAILRGTTVVSPEKRKFALTCTTRTDFERFCGPSDVFLRGDFGALFQQLGPLVDDDPPCSLSDVSPAAANCVVGELDPEVGPVQEVELGGLHRRTVLVDAFERERVDQSRQRENFLVGEI